MVIQIAQARHAACKLDPIDAPIAEPSPDVPGSLQTVHLLSFSCPLPASPVSLSLLGACQFLRLECHPNTHLGHWSEIMHSPQKDQTTRAHTTTHVRATRICGVVLLIQARRCGEPPSTCRLNTTSLVPAGVRTGSNQTRLLWLDRSSLARIGHDLTMDLTVLTMMMARRATQRPQDYRSMYSGDSCLASAGLRHLHHLHPRVCYSQDRSFGLLMVQDIVERRFLTANLQMSMAVHCRLTLPT